MLRCPGGCNAVLDFTVDLGRRGDCKMKSIKEIFRQTFGKYIPYLIQFIITLGAISYCHTYITEFCGGSDQKRALFICYLVIACTSILWARMTYLHQKMMKKLEQVELPKDKK